MIVLGFGLREIVPCLPTASVAHPLDAEGGSHGNVGIVRGGGQDGVHPLHSGNDVSHNPERVAVFPPFCLVVSTVLDNGIGEA